MKNLVILLIISLFLPKCSYIRHQQEMGQFKRTKYALKTSVPKHVLESCGYNLDLTLPEIIPTDKMGSKDGLYIPRRQVIIYHKYNIKILSHEMQHYLNDNGLNGPVSRDCLDEITSYYAAMILDLKSQNRALRSRLR